MTRTASGAEPTVAGPDLSPPPHRSVVLLGLLPTVAALVLLALDPNLTIEQLQLGAWVAGLSLYTLTILLAERLDRGPWVGYLQVSVLVIWLAAGLLGALALIVVGGLLAGGIWIGLARWLRLPMLPYSVVGLRLAARMLFALTALGVAALLHTLLGGTTPVRDLAGSELPRLVLVLAFAWMAVHAIWWALAAGQNAVPLRQVMEVERRWLYAGELYLLPLVLVLPPLLYNLGLGAFVAVVFLIAAYALRFHTTSQQARENAEQARKLSLIAGSVQNAMLNFNQQNALQIVCQTALRITGAEKAVVFLYDSHHEQMTLAQSIGFGVQAAPDLHHLVGSGPPAEIGLRVVPDVALFNQDDTRALAQRFGFRAFIELPLQTNSVTLGYLTVYYDHPHPTDHNELDLLKILVRQITTVLENAQLLRALELYAFETTHLIYLAGSPGSNLELGKIAADVADVVRTMMAVDCVVVSLHDADTDRHKIIGVSHDNGEPTCADALRQRLPSLPELADLHAAPRIMSLHVNQANLSADTADLMRQHGMSTLILSPMTIQGQVFGVLFIGTKQRHVVADSEQQLLEAATNQIATQLYNAHLYDTTSRALNRRMQQLAFIENIVQKISGSPDFSQIIDDVLEAAAATTQADMVALALLTEANDLWVILREIQDGKPAKRYLTMPKEQGVIGHVIRTGETLLVPDNRKLPHYMPTPPAEYLSSLVVPLLKDRAAIGALDVESSQLDFFTEEQSVFLRNLGAHAIISIENARLLEELQYQIDSLTSLRKLSLDLSLVVDTASVAHATLRAALDILDGQYALMFHYDEAQDRLNLIASLHKNGAAPFLLDTDNVRQAARQAAVTGETQTPAYQTMPPNSGTSPAPLIPPGLVAIPIRRGSDVYEVLCVAFAEQQSFQSRELNTLSMLAIQAAGHLENAALHERIREGSDRMRAILDSTRDGVILLDMDGRLAEVNPWAERLLGFNLSDHIGEPFVELLLHYADPDQDTYAGYSRDELTNLARFQRLEPEKISRRHFERRAAPNQMIYIEEIGSPVIGADNHVTGRLLVLRDVTEEKQLEIFRDEITSMIVHNLRGPLASIINSIRIARDQIPDLTVYPVAQQTMEMALESADRLMTLINSLLDIAKLETRQMVLQRQEYALQMLVDGAYQSLAASFNKASIRVEFSMPKDLPLVAADGEKIRQVLVNLLDNALRYTPAGGQVLVSAVPHGSKVLVKVADSGPGIPVAERERVFEKYRQLHANNPVRGSKGSGIGLTFSKLVIEAHGGRIWVEPDGPLPGACFALTLPQA